MFEFLQAILHKLTSFEVVLVLLTWVTAFLGAFITFMVRDDHGEKRTPRGFVRYCFPREILRSRSLYLDVGYAITFRMLYPFLIAPLLVSALVAAKWSRDLLEHFIGAREVAEHPGLLVWTAYTIGIVLFRDFIVFYGHYLQHRIPILWEFHKTHHSAEHLVPLTNRRFHPLQILIDEGSQAFCSGVWLGVSSYALGLDMVEATVLGIDAYFFTQIVCLYHLRHSHVYMTFGPLERLVMSPAQHQMHHSTDPKHWDHNFGLTFPIWDQLWGTHLVAEPSRWFKVGLDNDEHREFDTIFALYWRPIRRAARMIMPRPALPSASAIDADAKRAA